MSSQLTLFYHPISHYSRKVLISLYEKNVPFDGKIVDLYAEENLQPFYLKEVNPRGEVPVLRISRNDAVESFTTIIGSTKIIEYVDNEFDEKYRLYPQKYSPLNEGFNAKIDDFAVFPLTFGIALFHPDLTGSRFRYPFNAYKTKQIVERKRNFFEVEKVAKVKTLARDLKISTLEEAAEEIDQNLEIMKNKEKFKTYLRKLSEILDEAEKYLSESTGDFLFGDEFVAADVNLTALLMRLYQLGMDEVCWKGGKRPNLEVYQKRVFNRPSVEKATEWSKFEDEFIHNDAFNR